MTDHRTSEPCAADRVPRRVIDAIAREHARPTYDDGHTDCFFAGLFLVAFEALLNDDEALGRLRYAYLNSPPHAPKHTDAGRRAHIRAGLVAALQPGEVAA